MIMMYDVDCMYDGYYNISIMAHARSMRAHAYAVTHVRTCNALHVIDERCVLGEFAVPDAQD